MEKISNFRLNYLSIGISFFIIWFSCKTFHMASTGELFTELTLFNETPMFLNTDGAIQKTANVCIMCLLCV